MGEFDLLKEIDVLITANSLNVETMVVRKQFASDIVTLFFFRVSCLVPGLRWVILYN